MPRPTTSTASQVDRARRGLSRSTEFRENDDIYLVFSIVHIKHLGVFCAVFGLSAIGAFTATGLMYFPWKLYETSFNIIALMGFAIFFVFGIISHWAALYAIYKTSFTFAVPFLLFHGFLMTLEAVTALIAIGELVADQNLHVDHSDVVARNCLYAVPILIVIQSIMVFIMFRVRNFIRNKRRYIRNGNPPPIREVVNDSSSFGRFHLSAVAPLPPHNPSASQTLTSSPSQDKSGIV